MKFVGVTDTTWNENCRICVHATRRVIQEPGDLVLGDPDQVIDFYARNHKPLPVEFNEWAQNPVAGGDLWYCPYCELIWDTNNRWGINITCTWNGEIHQSSEIINMPSNVVEISPRPTPYHQMCTQCNIWREIVSVDVLYVDYIRKVTRSHRCPKCFNMSVFTSDESEAEQEERMRVETSGISRDMLSMGEMP